MGIFLDSSVSIAAERAHQSADLMIERILTNHGDQEVAISSIALTEILHGKYRAATPERAVVRERFIQDLLRRVPIHSYTRETAVLAARIGGEQAALGLTIPPVDLMIGATALHLDFSILTANERHFRLIPNLQVISF